MADNSFIAVPPDATDNPIALRRFLLRLIEQLDVAFGNRGTDAFRRSSEIASIYGTKAEIEATRLLLSSVAALTYVPLDGSADVQGILKYNTPKTFTDDEELIAKKYADDNFTNNPQGTDPLDIAVSASVGYIQSELQATMDKVDAVLAQLRVANII